MPQDKTLGLLYPLLVSFRPWKDIVIDFKDFSEAKNSMNTVVVFIDRLSKWPISIPCHKTYLARDLTMLYCVYILCYFRLLDTIVSN